MDGSPQTKRVTDELKSVTLSAGLKVWPVKMQTNSTRMFATKFQEMQGDFVATIFREVPNTEKFSKFIEQNSRNGRAFCMAMFPTPVQDPDDPANTLTVGFIFDVLKGTNVQTIHTNITTPGGYGSL